MRSFATLTLSMLAGVLPVEGGTPIATLVADVATETTWAADSSQQAYWAARSLPANLGPHTYFFADDGFHGRELWRSDGTAAGTTLVADLCPGHCGAASLYAQLAVASTGSRVFFAADDGVHGLELWAITQPGGLPELVADIVPGLRSGSPSMFQPVGERLFFTAGLPGNRSIWVSDGSSSGTHRVPVPWPGEAWYGASADVGGILVFGETPAAGLWRSDGTATGTYRLTPVQPWQNSWPAGAPFVVLGNRLLFSGRDGTGPYFPALWSTDGTIAGTVEVAHLYEPWNFALCDGWLFFTAGDYPRALYRTQGTPETTFPVPLPPDVRPAGYFGQNTCAGPTYVFGAWDEEHGDEPWRADASGATLLADLAPGPASSVEVDISEVWHGAGNFFASLGDSVLFLADDGVHGTEPWVTDGTTEGTHLVADSIAGAEGISEAALSLALPHPLVDGAVLYFERAPTGELRLWRSDTSAAGTFTIAPFENRSSSILFPVERLSIFGGPGPSCVAAIGDGLSFAADDAITGRELWHASVKSGQVSQAADVTPGPLSSTPVGCAAIGNRALFAAYNDPILGTQSLFSFDGATGVVEVLAAEIFAGWSFDAAELDNSLVLALESIWTSDGTPGGTAPLGALGDGPFGPKEVARSGGQLFVGGDHLYRWDPDLHEFVTLTGPGEPWIGPTRLSPFAGGLLFFAAHPDSGFELWRSDGTPAGTALVADVLPGPASAIGEEMYFPERPSLSNLVSLGDRAYFAADDGVHGEELWETDGTAAGTRLVADLFAGPYPSAPTSLVRAGAAVFFAAEDPAHGRELWVLDGTMDGPRIVADLAAGPDSSRPEKLTAVRDELWFSAWTPDFGREPWRVRRSASGLSVERLADIANGPPSSSPLFFENVGADVFLAADDGVHGFELWKIRDPDLLFADDFESSGLGLWDSAAP